MSNLKQFLGLNVGQLRKALEGLPDELEIVVRAEDADGNSFCGGIVTAAPESHHDDYFAIDCSDDEEALEAAG